MTVRFRKRTLLYDRHQASSQNSQCVVIAKKSGIKLRQSYSRTAKELLLAQRFFSKLCRVKLLKMDFLTIHQLNYLVKCIEISE